MRVVDGFSFSAVEPAVHIFFLKDVKVMEKFMKAEAKRQSEGVTIFR